MAGPLDKEVSTLPPMIGNIDGANVYDGYVVKYYKAEADDIGAMAALAAIETRGIRGDGVLILKKDTYVFMDRFFIVMQYIEKT